MAAKDRFKKKNCFIPFTIPEWNVGDEKYTIRSLTPDEQVLLSNMYEASSAEKENKELQEKCLLFGFSLFFADEGGNRVYGDNDLAEIKENIPLLVINRVATAGLQFTGDDLKKN